MKKENYNMKTKPVKRCREDVIFDTVIFIILTLILFGCGLSALLGYYFFLQRSDSRICR